MRRRIPKGATMELTIDYGGAREICALLIAIPASAFAEMNAAEGEYKPIYNSPLDRKPTADGHYWLIDGEWISDPA